ncbi:Hsp70 family protein [Aspergillus lucknowensis]|uniref:Actin-like ATPase domain-containing protein n=1 Tax=Aspergillus lucknowensis TaxID=176173 RepID=A0ABR4M4V9_9EURO
MADNWIPDIVVGVDFGMTCTGVAYSYAPNWPAPKSIQHWPGLMGSQVATKVPSHILYHDNTTKWGFQCEENVPDAKDIKQYFKLNLDPGFVDSRPDAPTREQATRYFQDYIRCVYQYVLSYFAKTMPRFDGMKVEFVFSVPTTWKDPRMVAELRESIVFDRPEHRATIGLTEAEAAAVYVSGLHYQKNDVILVCDAGGGTTDVNVLKLASAPGEPTIYNPLGFVEGKPVGSVFIDLGVHQLVCAKLEPVRLSLPGTTEDIAWKMMIGRFERFKCSFGVEGEQLPTLKLELPATLSESHFPEQGIHNGQLYITSDEVRGIFDAKIDDLFDLLDEQIRRLQLSHPTEKISFLVLSGGFGSCPYVRERLTTRYETPTHLLPGGVKVLTVDEPQLAVAQGQVMNRTQQLKSGGAVFNHLYSPVSYGVICDWLYDPKKHVGEPTRWDERNQKTYAINQIDWLVLQGDLVPRTGIQRSFPRKISPRDLSRPFTAQIVMSQLPRDQLPSSMTRGGAKLICELEVDTASVDKKPKNHRWYNRAPVYFMVTVIVKLVVEPAGLQFELWNAAGQRITALSRSSAGAPRRGSLSARSSVVSSSSGYPGGGTTSRPGSGPPITIRWEAMAEKMQDESDSERRGPAFEPRSPNRVSEMRNSTRIELPGDMGPASNLQGSSSNGVGRGSGSGKHVVYSPVAGSS